MNAKVLLLVALAVTAVAAQPAPNATAVNATALDAAANVTEVEEALPSPSPEVEPSPAVEPSPVVEPVVEPSPVPTEPMESPEPEPSPSPEVEAVVPEESPAPAEEAPVAAALPGAVAAAAGSNSTDARVTKFFSSPATAMNSVPELSELAALAEASPAASKLLADRNLVSTIFAPNNDAVAAALALLDANGAPSDAATLGAMGFLDQILSYHVTMGAAAITSERLATLAGKAITMQDGNQTTVALGARRRFSLRRLAAVNGSEPLFIVSDSNQRIGVTEANIQGGKSIIHVIDGVMVPEVLVQAVGLNSSSLPGYEADAFANSLNASAPAEPLNETETSSDPTVARDVVPPTSSPAPARSAAGMAVAALLAVPVALAALAF